MKAKGIRRHVHTGPDLPSFREGHGESAQGSTHTAKTTGGELAHTEYHRA